MASPNTAPTPAATPTPAPLHRLQSAARTMFGGLLWGGILLLILAFWLGRKYAEEGSRIVPWIIGLAGAASLALAGWHAYVLWLQKAAPEQKASLLANLRRLTAPALLVGGALLLVQIGRASCRERV